MRFVRARGWAGARAAIAHLRTAAFVAAPALAFLGSGCSSSTYYAGTPVVTIKGLPGGFSTYRIYVNYITITRNDGYVAYLLNAGGGLGEQVDLADLQDNPELLEAQAAPTGTYTSATIQLDFGGVSGIYPVIASNINGNAATITDDGTNAAGYNDISNQASPPSSLYLGVVTFTVNFDPAHPMVVTYNECDRLEFDFNLEASNILDNSGAQNGGSPTVYVNPVVTANANPVDTKPVHARGVFVVAQPGQSDFIMNILPLNDGYYYEPLGALTVQTTAQTYFNINGVTYTGAAGLAQMANLQQDTVVHAYGSIPDLTNVGITPTFNATTVIAGNAAASTIQGHVTGIVAERSDNLLVIRGGTYYPPFGYTTYGYGDVQGYVPTFANNTSIIIDPTTIVSQDGVANPNLNLQSVSVGQTIDVSGQASYDPNTDYLTLDATEAGTNAVYAGSNTPGQVRILPSDLWGTVTSATPGNATLNLLQLGQYITPAFTFTGTNSNAASYNVTTGSTDLSQVTPGTLVSMVGDPPAFGSAPPDFNATSVNTNLESEVVVEWWSNLTPTSQAFSATSANSLTIDTTNSSRQAFFTGPIPQSTLCGGTGVPVISTANSSSLQLTIGPDPSTTLLNEYVYSDLPDFEKEYNTLQTAGDKFTKLVAFGQCDPTAANTFDATRIILAVQ